MKRGDVPASIFATLLLLATLGLIVNALFNNLASTLTTAIETSGDVATTALKCVAAVAALAVLGYFARDIARIRVGGDIEAMRNMPPTPSDPQQPSRSPGSATMCSRGSERSSRHSSSG